MLFIETRFTHFSWGVNFHVWLVLPFSRMESDQPDRFAGVWIHFLAELDHSQKIIFGHFFVIILEPLYQPDRSASVWIKDGPARLLPCLPFSPPVQRVPENFDVNKEDSNWKKLPFAKHVDGRPVGADILCTSQTNLELKKNMIFFVVY